MRDLVLISNFRRVLNVVFFLFGDSPASEFYVPTFRNTSIFLVGVNRNNTIILHLFVISNFRLVLNVVFFHLGDSPASEFHVPTFRNTICSIFIAGVIRKNTNNSTFVLDFKISPYSGCCILFLVIPRRLNFMCRRFGTHCSIFIGVVSRKNKTNLYLFPLNPVTGFVWISEPTAVGLWCGQVQLYQLCSFFTVK
jgi:hypothetical protein